MPTIKEIQARLDFLKNPLETLSLGGPLKAEKIKDGYCTDIAFLLDEVERLRWHLKQIVSHMDECPNVGKDNRPILAQNIARKALEEPILPDGENGQEK